MAAPTFVGAQNEVAPPDNQAGASANDAAPASSQADANANSQADANANTQSRTVSADQIPPAQAQALAQGDNKLVTNGPVPDTAANRAKFGQPMSHTGKATPPTGD
jgi:hypothetical protein